jgi:hypothetical protein
MFTTGSGVQTGALPTPGALITGLGRCDHLALSRHIVWWYILKVALRPVGWDTASLICCALLGGSFICCHVMEKGRDVAIIHARRLKSLLLRHLWLRWSGKEERFCHVVWLCSETLRQGAVT